ncbi:hypothetical protein BuS5_00205 [Desulfosarcina sp. BuS5]|uniref:hypothetical protein n=1 Tax=Desulfosarcina sp. BuS5 TaxID=933262 RepID=UPI0004808DB8|nr:hypothetical protein [Desulfosarcina sp. BuS5]WDN87237.1 hypothetical protein BuS5_00205 [Desulfosarcina sp. BuS5]
MRKYIHQKKSDDVIINTISGYYTIEKEENIDFKGRDLLCVTGMGIIDSSCCGVGGCRYALVPGYVQSSEQDENGSIISEVEPVFSKEDKVEIIKILKEQEVVTQVEFW